MRGLALAMAQVVKHWNKVLRAMALISIVARHLFLFLFVAMMSQICLYTLFTYLYFWFVIKYLFISFIFSIEQKSLSFLEVTETQFFTPHPFCLQVLLKAMIPRHQVSFLLGFEMFHIFLAPL